MTAARKAAHGVHVVHMIGLMLIIMMGSTLAVDFGFYFTAQNQLQTSSDSAALAAVSGLYYSDSPGPLQKRKEAELAAFELVTENQADLTLDEGDVTFGFVDPQTRRYAPNSFATPSGDPDYAWSGGFNAVRVAVRRTAESSNGSLPTIMASMLGIRQMDALAFSVAFMDQHVIAIEDGGLRPIYSCQGQVDRAWSDGRLENNVIRIYGDRMMVDADDNLPNCPPPGSGNWGFADLRNCGPDVPGSNDTAEWFQNGFRGKVEADRCYSTQSGNFLANSGVEEALDQLIAGQTVIILPVYDEYSGGGANTRVDISGFVGFVVTGYRSNGSASGRYVEGYFTKALCRGTCTTSGDSGLAPGGAVVKLRLAGRDT